jgi:hypothetical protein
MRTHFIFALALLVTGCGLETEPNPNYQSGSGGSGGNGGSDAGDAGGEGGTGGGGSGGNGGNGGTTGGSGGSGGDSAVTDCDDNSECSPNTPQCNPQGQCISCTSDAACKDRGPLAHCEMSRDSEQRGRCVACLDDGDCDDSDDGDYCLNNECVPCESDTDCTDLTKPECGADGQCTGCTSDDACDGRDGFEACVTAAGPKRGHCVACIGDDDCTSTDAPECKSDNTCGACTSDDACDGRNGAEHCNLRTGAETFGKCVECTGATEDDDCDGKSCKQTTGECTEVEIGDLNPCEACEADSQCGTGTKCVQHMLGETDLGYFCFFERATCADTDSAVKPYSRTLPNALSIDSTGAAQQATYCLPPTSCKAVDDASGVVAPGDVTCTVNSDCGVEDINDGQCIERAAEELKCTYACDDDFDCPADLSKCLGSGVKVCSP